MAKSEREEWLTNGSGLDKCPKSETLSETRQKFEEWCPIKVIDAAKAPQSYAIANAYWTAWQAASEIYRLQGLEEAAKQLELAKTRLAICLGRFRGCFTPNGRLTHELSIEELPAWIEEMETKAGAIREKANG